MLWNRLFAPWLGWTATAAVVGMGLLVERASAADPPAAVDPPVVTAAPRTAKQDLTPESLPALHALVRPHDHEWRHLRVGWLTDVVAARRQAAAEDKPIVVLYTGGAGYNEPLGVC